MRTIANGQHYGSKLRQRSAGLALSWLAVLFLLFDSAGKLLQVQPVIDGTLQLGYPRDIVFSLGVILLSCVVAYVIPRTSVLGALLLTGYLGGAVATHVRVAEPALQPRPVSDLCRGAALGRTDPARRAVARVPAGSEGVMSQVKSQDGTPIAYERSGSGPALILVDGALCSRAFGPSPKLAPLLARHFTVFRVRPPRPRAERRHAAVFPGARGRGHRGAHRGSRRVGVSPRAVVGRGAGPRSRGRRPSDRQGRRLRAALRGRRRATGRCRVTRANSNVSLRAEIAAAR